MIRSTLMNLSLLISSRTRFSRQLGMMPLIYLGHLIHADGDLLRLIARDVGEEDVVSGFVALERGLSKHAVRGQHHRYQEDDSRKRHGIYRGVGVPPARSRLKPPVQGQDA